MMSAPGSRRLSPSFPASLIANTWFPDLYGMVNVPTILWIDEEGRIARPNDVTFGSNQFQEMTGSIRNATSSDCGLGSAAAERR